MITDSLQVDKATATSQGKETRKGDSDLSAAQQFLQLFSSTVVAGYSPGEQNVDKGSAAFEKVFDVKARAFNDTRQTEHKQQAEREKIEIKPPEDGRKTEAARHDKPEPVTRERAVETGSEGNQEKTAEVRNEERGEARAAKPVSLPKGSESTEKSAEKQAAPKLRQAANAQDISGPETQKTGNQKADVLQEAVRKSHLNRQQNHQVDKAAETKEGENLKRPSRLVEAINQAAEKSAVKAKPQAVNAHNHAVAAEQVKAGKAVQAAGENQQANNQQQGSQAGENQVILRAITSSAINSAKNSAEFTSTLKSTTAQVAKANGPSPVQGTTGNTSLNLKGELARTAASSKTEQPVRARQTEIIKQIVRSARLAAQNGKQEMKLLLKPEHLGWLKVRMSVEGQKVTAHITTESEDVKNMVEKNIGQLQNSFQSGNLRVNQIVVEVSGQENAQLNMSGTAEDLLNQQGNGKSGESSGESKDSRSEETPAEEQQELAADPDEIKSGVDVKI